MCHSGHVLQACAGCHPPLESLLKPSRERQLDLRELLPGGLQGWIFSWGTAISQESFRKAAKGLVIGLRIQSSQLGLMGPQSSKSAVSLKRSPFLHGAIPGSSGSACPRPLAFEGVSWGPH